MDPKLPRGNGQLSVPSFTTKVRSFSGQRSRSYLTALGLAFILGSTGCSSPTDPPLPPSGGREFELSFDDFVATVAPVFYEYGCNAAGDCHGGGIRGSFELSSPEAQDLAFDFEKASLQVLPYNLERSPILAKPLSERAGGVRHSSEPFASTNDPGYVAIRDWIYQGRFR